MDVKLKSEDGKELELYGRFTGAVKCRGEPGGAKVTKPLTVELRGSDDGAVVIIKLDGKVVSMFDTSEYTPEMADKIL